LFEKNPTETPSESPKSLYKTEI